MHFDQVTVNGVNSNGSYYTIFIDEGVFLTEIKRWQGMDGYAILSNIMMKNAVSQCKNSDSMKGAVK